MPSPTIIDGSVMFSDRPSGCPSVNTCFTWRDISIYLLVEEVNETWLPEIFITAIAEEVVRWVIIWRRNWISSDIYVECQMTVLKQGVWNNGGSNRRRWTDEWDDVEEWCNIDLHTLSMKVAHRTEWRQMVKRNTLGNNRHGAHMDLWWSWSEWQETT